MWTFYSATGEAMIQDGAMTIANNADNRVVTATGADPASLNGESTLTYDGTHLTISDGNLVIGTAGHGIDFSANSQSTVTGASMASELLDWYEEGTWTPNLHDSSGNNADQSGATRVGRYTRIGNRVHFHFQVLLDTITGLVNNQVTIRGLPFTSANVANTESVIGFGHGSGMAITAGVYVNGLVGVNQAIIYMTKWSATTGVSDFVVNELSADGKLKATGVYEV